MDKKRPRKQRQRLLNMSFALFLQAKGVLENITEDKFPNSIEDNGELRHFYRVLIFDETNIGKNIEDDAAVKKIKISDIVEQAVVVKALKFLIDTQRQQNVYQTFQNTFWHIYDNYCRTKYGAGNRFSASCKPGETMANDWYNIFRLNCSSTEDESPFGNYATHRHFTQCESAKLIYHEIQQRLMDLFYDKFTIFGFLLTIFFVSKQLTKEDLQRFSKTPLRLEIDKEHHSYTWIFNEKKYKFEAEWKNNSFVYLHVPRQEIFEVMPSLKVMPIAIVNPMSSQALIDVKWEIHGSKNISIFPEKYSDDEDTNKRLANLVRRAGESIRLLRKSTCNEWLVRAVYIPHGPNNLPYVVELDYENNTESFLFKPRNPTEQFSHVIRYLRFYARVVQCLLLHRRYLINISTKNVGMYGESFFLTNLELVNFAQELSSKQPPEKLVSQKFATHAEDILKKMYGDDYSKKYFIHHMLPNAVRKAARGGGIDDFLFSDDLIKMMTEFFFLNYDQYVKPTADDDGIIFLKLRF